MKNRFVKEVKKIQKHVVCDIFNIRPFDTYVHNNYSKHSSFCEVGVWKGAHAYRMMKYHNPEKLYLIDRVIQPNVKRIFSSNNHVKLIEEPSSRALDQIPDVDFIYIDGAHDYENVKKDLQYYHKAKYVLGGHDWDAPGVAKAVIEFVNEYDIKNFKIMGRDWIIDKY